MYRLLRPILFRLDPERAHDLATGLLEKAQGSTLARGWLKTFYGAPPRPKRVAGLDFPNPVGLAAGFDKACRLARVLPSLGFGFLELGTVTAKPQPGNPKPRLFRLPEQGALINRFGFNNPGAAAAAESLAMLRDRPVPIGINVGKSAATPIEEAVADYLNSLQALYEHGDYFVLNISSPNTKGLRRLHEKPRLEALVAGVRGWMEKSERPKPFFVKLSPDVDDDGVEALVETCREFGAGIVVSNTTTRREGVPGRWLEQPGGLSGRPLRERSTALIRRVRALAGRETPIIGVGGIFSPEDAKEKIDAGADLVQVYTGWIYEGPGLVRRIVEAL